MNTQLARDPAPSAATRRTPPRTRTREDILAIIRASSDMSRADIVDRTGLPGSTVSHVLGALLADGRIVKARRQPKGPGSGSGRPGTFYKAVAFGHPTAAIDFGHSHIRVAIANDLGDPIDEVAIRLDVDLDAFTAMDAAAEQLLLLQRTHRISELTAIVAGVPGPVDKHTGVICSPTILSGWVGLEPAKELQRRLGVPVHVENDAALGAYGERLCGAGRAHTDFLYVKASNGIGVGLVINGELYTGVKGLAGEIGHTAIPGQAEYCRCGKRGCLEAVVSARRVNEHVVHSHPGIDPRRLVLAHMDDPVTATLLEEAGRTLGRALADMCNLFNPSAVILGGDLGAAGPSLIGGVQASISRYAQPATADSLVVLPAELGVRAEVVGGLQAASRLHRV